MSSTPVPVHDASTGFRDIKPIADFHPSIISPELLLIAAAIALAVLYFIKRKKKSPILATPIEPPDELALRELSQLDLNRQQATVTIREFAQQLSLILRRYIESSLLFPAMDQTANEVILNFSPALKRALPRLPAKPLKESENPLDQGKSETPLYSNAYFETVLRRILKTCEMMSFADTADINYSLASADTALLIKQTAEIIKALSDLLRKEEEFHRLQLANKTPSAQQGGTWN